MKGHIKEILVFKGNMYATELVRLLDLKIGERLDRIEVGKIIVEMEKEKELEISHNNYLILKRPRID